MGEPPSRNPGDYEPTSHFLQRKRYRDTPPIPDYVIKTAIEDGTWIAEYNQFKLIERVGGKRHEFTVQVNPETKTAITVFCACHKDGPDCTPHRFHTRQ